MKIVVKYKTPASPIVEFICNGPKIINALLCSFSQEKAKRSALEIVDFRESLFGLPNEDKKRYEKWLDVLSELMDQKYGEELEEKYGREARETQIKKMAKLEAGNMLPIFTESEMYHVMDLGQINCLLGLMHEYIKRTEEEAKTSSQVTVPEGYETDEQYKALLAQKLCDTFKAFDEACQMNNLVEKNPNPPRIIAPFQFGNNLKDASEVFNKNYSVRFSGSFLQLMQRLGNGEQGLSFEYVGPQEGFTLPRILAFEDLDTLEMNWQEDMISGRRRFLQGQKVVIMENQDVDWLIQQTADPIALAIPSETISQIAKTKGRISSSTRDGALKLLLSRHIANNNQGK